MKRIALLILDIYRILFSPLLFTLFGKGCRYKIECSLYTRQTIEKYGLIKGIQKGTKRLATCHPFNLKYTN